MKRKECDNLVLRLTSVRQRNAVSAGLAGIVAVLACAPAVQAQSERAEIRMWPTAWVVGDEIKLDEVAELRGFESELGRKLAETVVAQAPVAGGTRYVSMDMLRPALRQAGANLAQVSLRGALRCAVSRPAEPAAAPAPAALPVPDVQASPADSHPKSALEQQSTAAGANSRTVKQAVIDYFDAELERYGGTAELVFGHADEQVLALAESDYVFSVTRQGDGLLGLVRFEVQVWSGSRRVQTVPLVARVTMMRDVVVARRAINQGATIRPQDIQIIPTSFTRLDKLGVADPAQVIGQRARRFLLPGSTIDPVQLEEVPLVVRNQLVTLTTEVGSIAITTSAKAMATGGLGEVIAVRSVENRKLEYEAVITGPGKVRMGGGPGAAVGRAGELHAQR